MKELFASNQEKNLTSAENGEDSGTSRRAFLTGSAKLIGGGALAVALGPTYSKPVIRKYDQIEQVQAYGPSER